MHSNYFDFAKRITFEKLHRWDVGMGHIPRIINLKIHAFLLKQRHFILMENAE